MATKQTIADFETGDEVFHLSDSTQKMVIIEKNLDTNELKCRWLKNGAVEMRSFLSFELNKCADGFKGATFHFRSKNSNRY